VDTVGGNILGTLIRATRLAGCVAACGMAAGTGLPVTVFPFILRGVTLAGIEAAWVPTAARSEIWDRLAVQWKLDNLDAIAQPVDLEQLPSKIPEILAGRIIGRVVVRIQDEIEPTAAGGPAKP
jgi:NADPH:quinone reductase-like Zn-dependent oxidoreductase